MVGDGVFPWGPGRRAELVEVRRLGDVVLLRYALSSRCRKQAPSWTATGSRFTRARRSEAATA